ncbi:hypothetical protein EDC04DRAFT_2603928 [Pisolithus marmoratus]|nr:hypothetical protein EDC04DRAFT_2603928 [Pisolithus marmoratus]
MTLQCIKGLTMGSLLAIVDIGESFSGSVIQDSLLHQLGSLGCKVSSWGYLFMVILLIIIIAFTSNNMWLSLFPSFLDHNLSYPFESFDIEDLHTVDSGVMSYLLSIIQQCSEPQTLAISHGLRVDHAGHHDQAGNHGGNSIFEASSAVWIYIHSAPLLSSLIPLPPEILPKTTFPGEYIPHHSIQQIDLVPTILLLLSLLILFNNIGTMILELFDQKDSSMNEALGLNACQIKQYLTPIGQAHLVANWMDYLDGIHAHHLILFSGALASSLLLILTCKP